MNYTNLIKLSDIPAYDLFLSQVLELLNTWFPDEGYTANIIQNYIKDEIISKPLKGKKRGYTKEHMIQLILVSYLRPVLRGDEIKSILSLAFNEINNDEDDIITWEDAYSIFLAIWEDNNTADTLEYERRTTEKHLKKLNLNRTNPIEKFITALILCSRASLIKHRVKDLIKSE